MLLLKNLTHRFPPHCFGTGLAAKQPKRNKTWTPHLIPIVVVVGGRQVNWPSMQQTEPISANHGDPTKYESSSCYMSTAGEKVVDLKWPINADGHRWIPPPLPLIHCVNVPPTFLKTGRSKLEGPCHWDDLKVIATLKAQVTSVFLLLERLLGHSHEKRMGKHVQQFPREVRWMITSYRGAS